MLTYIPLSMRGGGSKSPTWINTDRRYRKSKRYEDSIIGLVDQEKRNNQWAGLLEAIPRDRQGVAMRDPLYMRLLVTEL